MRISEAIAELEEIKDAEGDVEVMLSSDEEGNRHRNLYGIQVDWYHEEGGWDGGPGPVADEDVDTGYPRDELERKVTLW